MKVSLMCGLLLCMFLIVLGVLVWFAPCLLIEKIAVSVLCILSGVAFGAMGIEILIDA